MTPATDLVQARLPQAGELSHAWRIATSITWIGVVLALAAVWNTSEQLGLSTWWLGPRGQPQPRLVQLAPFLAPVLMLLATINNVKRLGWLGLLASGTVAAVGIIDLGRVAKLGLLELLIASAGAAVSIGSMTGTYRRNEITG